MSPSSCRFVSENNGKLLTTSPRDGGHWLPTPSFRQVQWTWPVTSALFCKSSSSSSTLIFYCFVFHFEGYSLHWSVNCQSAIRDKFSTYLYHKYGKLRKSVNAICLTNPEMWSFGTSWYLLWSSSDANHHAIKKLTSYGTRSRITVFTTTGHWNPSVIKEYQFTPSILFNVYFSINITSALRSSKGSLLKFFLLRFYCISDLFH